MKNFRTIFLIDVLILSVAFILPGFLNISAPPGHADSIDPLVTQIVLLAYVLISWAILMYWGGKPNPGLLRLRGLLPAMVGLCLSANFLIVWDATYRPSWGWLAIFGATSFILLALMRIATPLKHSALDVNRSGLLPLLIAGALFSTACIIRLFTAFFIWKIIRLPLVIIGTLFLCAFYASACTDKLESSVKKIINIRGWLWAGIVALIAVIIAALLSQLVLGGIPHIQDSIAMLFQTKIFASGRLYADAPPMPKAFDCEFIVVDGNKWYGKYFPGFSILLILGVIAKLPWLVNPIIAGCSLIVIFFLAKDLFGEKIAKAAIFLALLSPFFLFMSASYMSHTTSMFLTSLFLLATIRSIRRQRSYLWPFVGGLALGFNLITRPYTALLLGLPPVFYFLTRARSQGELIKRFTIFLIPIAILIAGLGYYNFSLTGDPFLFPFIKYNPVDFFGYGENVGISHLPERGYSLHEGISNFKNNLTVLSKDLFGWPRWAFLFILFPLLSPYRKREDLLLFALFIILSIGYSLWWYHGICFGARFWYEAMPAYLILAARSLQIAYSEARRWKIHPHLFVSALLAFLVCCNLVTYFPEAVGHYGDSFWGVDRVLEDEIRNQGITEALIFIDSKHYAAPGNKGYPDAYLSAFSLNDPDLAGDFVCVRRMDAEKNKLLAGKFPGLPPYLFIHPDPEYSPTRAQKKPAYPVLSPLHLNN